MHYRILDSRPAGKSFQPGTQIVLCELGENKVTPQATWVYWRGERYWGHYFTTAEIEAGKAREDFVNRGKH